jgi:hypothetical protein
LAFQLIIDKLLGHANSKNTENYLRLAANPVRAVNEAKGRQIAMMLNGKTENLANAVVECSLAAMRQGVEDQILKFEIKVGTRE